MCSNTPASSQECLSQAWNCIKASQHLFVMCTAGTKVCIGTGKVINYYSDLTFLCLSHLCNTHSYMYVYVYIYMHPYIYKYTSIWCPVFGAEINTSCPLPSGSPECRAMKFCINKHLHVGHRGEKKEKCSSEGIFPFPTSKALYKQKIERDQNPHSSSFLCITYCISLYIFQKAPPTPWE